MTRAGQEAALPIPGEPVLLRLLAGKEERAPAIPLQPGENWRFHFDMSKCIGCKCCEVACHEQNNNPPDVKWRRVGEVEGGVFPDTKHFFTSMACNHCLEPTCLSGCPVDAYKKDPGTGVVLLDTKVCIGCQYCTWNCSYGAPQFNEERGVVTKCDLCHNRLSAGELPACVAACPSGAIEIESFRPAEWRLDLSGANAPGLPDAGITVSATRITLPAGLGDELQRIDDFRLKPDKPHYSLIVLTVFTQLAVGGFISLLAVEWAGQFLGFPPAVESVLRAGALVMLGAAALALGVSVFHLGKPLFAWRALKMWRRSWLSREVLCFGLFAGLAFLHAALRWFLPEPSSVRYLLGALGALVALAGLAGVYASARIYLVPARPSWDTWRTPVAFFATAFLLGPLVALLVLAWGGTASGGPLGTLLIAAVLLAGFAQLAGIIAKLLGSFDAKEPERAASARLLTGHFRRVFLLRLGALLLAVLFVPLAVLGAGSSPFAASLALTFLAAAVLGSELVGRYLFFVTVVPKNRPEGYA